MSVKSTRLDNLLNIRVFFSKKNAKRLAFCFGLIFLGTFLQVLILKWINPPITVPMITRWLENQFVQKNAPSSRYVWADLNTMPPNFLAAVWISEDRNFFNHYGFDWEQIAIARNDARATGKPARGASTITQQCARSVFLWPGRSWVRKGLEVYYTILMELTLSKQRIFEIYTNVIELGDGLYGVTAASQYYYSVPPTRLTDEQSAMLVAIMPNPRQWNPLLPNERVIKRQKLILERSKMVIWPLESALSK